MLSSIFTVSLAQSALELGCIYSLVALALFVSFSLLNIADLSTDGCFTLGCATCAVVTAAGHPFLALFAAMAAGVTSGFVTAFLQTRLGVASILAGIIVNTGLYTINIMVMGYSSQVNLFSYDTVFTLAKESIGGSWYKLLTILIVVVIISIILIWFLGTRLGLSIRATAEKVIDLTRSIVAENHITCLMITHNMQQALDLGSRTIMMDNGQIILDVQGEEREGMTVADMLEKFREVAGRQLDNDRILLSGAKGE